MSDISCIVCSLRLSYRNLSGLFQYIVIVFVYVNCEVARNRL